ncbi:hypothetical protein [Marinoscillum luteum]|uniref:LPS export ABC transporter periplasmic protein LptC n=1 Tax=Marinoscillum luteum TaxID=861051 RepID=A0ABW7N4T8_9BACT
MNPYKPVVILLLLLAFSCSRDNEKVEYYENGFIKFRSSISEDTTVIERFYDEKEAQIKSIIKSLNDTVYIAKYYAINGQLSVRSELDRNKIVKYETKNNEWLIGPQDGPKYLSVITDLKFPRDMDEYFTRSINSDGLYVHLPLSDVNIEGLLFEHEVEIFSDSSGFFFGTHTYFNVP